MSNDLRTTTFQMEFNGNDAITGMSTLTRTVRDTDKMVEELNKTMGENGTVTVKNVKTKKELMTELRRVASETQRAESRTHKLTEQYSHMASTVGKTADEIQVLNAVQQLGANATKQQIEQVANSVRSYQQLRDAQNKQQGSMRNSRGVMQNFGWQMQDTVVQLQMGTSAFVVLSQQGSQMASAFGPKGAIVGMFIALAGVVGGTLFKSLQSATEKTKELDAANKALNEYITINTKGIVELSSKYEELARFSKIAADAQLVISRIKANDAQAASIKLIGDELKGLERDLQTIDKYATGSKGFGTLGIPQTKSVEDMRKSFNRLKTEVNPQNIQDFVSYLADLETTGKKGNKRLTEFVELLNNQLVSMSRNKEILKQTEDGWKGVGKESRDTASDVVKAFEKEAQSLTRQTETLEDEYQRRRKVIFDFLDSGEKSEEDAAKAFANLMKWRSDEEEKIRKKSFEKQWGDITKAFEQESKRTTKQTETISQEYDRRYQVIKAYTEKPGHDAEKVAKALIELEEWKTAEYTKEYEKRERVRRQIENAQIRSAGKDDPIGAEKAKFGANLATLVGQGKSLEENQLEEKQRIFALIEAEVERHNTVMADLEMQGLEAQVGAYQMAAQGMSNLVNLMTTGAEGVRQQTEDMTGVQKGMFVTMQIIAAAMAVINGISMGSKLAEAAATYDWTGATSLSWLTIGTTIGAAQAGAIMGTTIAGAFDNGGYIPSGQMGAVAGFGDEFVNGTLIQGPANVTSRKDTAELLRDGAGGGGGVTKLDISIENKIEGGQYSVEQLSEGRVRIIAEQVFSKNIDNGVSTSLANSNSKSAKTMRRSYTAGRRL